MAKVIIEIQAENSVYKTHRSFDQLPIRIGRGYANDLILNDPFLSENHLIIREDEEGWIIEDLESQNGTYLVKESRVTKQNRIISGDEFIAGKTKMRILDSQHPVPPPKILVFRSPFIKKISQPINAISITIVLLIIYILEEYLKSAKNFPPVKLISESVGVLVFVALWAGFWAFVGRLIKKNAQFTAQWSISAIFFILLIPGYYLIELMGYRFADLFKIGLLSSCTYGLLFMLLLTKNLQIATNISLIKRSIASFLITSLILLLGVLSYYADKTEFYPFPKYSSTLKPPAIKWFSGIPVDEFLKESQTIFQED